jgi:hypothetical protein
MFLTIKTAIRADVYQEFNCIAMLDLKSYSNNFSGFDIPDTLQQLIAFENSLPQNVPFCQGFKLGNYENKMAVKCYSEDPAFCNRLVEFAYASEGGSVYAFWIRDTSRSLEHAPIVVFGDEGGVHIVAVNLLALLQILTFDTAPTIDWDLVYYYKGKESEPSSLHQEYMDWLLEYFGIEATDDPGAIVADAQQKHQEAFRTWMGQYFEG